MVSQFRSSRAQRRHFSPAPGRWHGCGPIGYPSSASTQLVAAQWRHGTLHRILSC
ncbi:hypothetical protein BDW62DRAFT_194211 [Aspergillus aurantiobrunneus]